MRRTKIISRFTELVLVLTLLSSVAVTFAQAPPPAVDGVLLSIKGEVKQELRLTAADWKVMKREKLTAKDHSGVAHDYEGVSLQALLLQAGVPQGAELRGKNMTLVVIAEATDSYRAAFSLAELDADFAGAQALVADSQDGKPLDEKHGPLQLVVPGDKHQGRWVRLLKTIAVQRIGESK